MFILILGVGRIFLLHSEHTDAVGLFLLIFSDMDKITFEINVDHRATNGKSISLNCANVNHKPTFLQKC